MNFIDFVQFVKTRCMYETIYEDSDSNLILVIRMLDAYAMAGKFGAVTQWPSAAIGKETLQDAIERERAVGYREGHRAALAQRTWVGLTDEEIKDCFKITPDQHLPWHIYQRIEAKLKEKNSA